MVALEPVVGQDALKRRLVAAFSQYTAYRINPAVGRPLILVAGPSGTGKTYSVQLISRYIGLPYTEVSAASIAVTAHKGMTFRDLLAMHFIDHKTDDGIIFLDEIDKWCAGAIGQDFETSAIGKRLQSEALRMMISEKVVFMDEMDLEENETDESRTFRTSQPLWVIAGAYTGLDQIIKSRLHGHHNIPNEELWLEMTHGDLIQYGMLTELVGRIQTLAYARPLTNIEMIGILKAQEVPMWIEMFKMIDCELIIHEGALSGCAERAMYDQTGVRGATSYLRRGMEEMFTEASTLQLRQLVVDRVSIETGRFTVVADTVIANAV